MYNATRRPDVPPGKVRRALLDDDLERDVAAGGVAVRAHLLGGLGQLPRRRLVQPGNGDKEPNTDPVGPSARAPEVDLGRHRGVGQVDLARPGHQVHGALEAGGEAGGEQLLGVRAVSTPTQLLRGVEADVEAAVERTGVT